MIDSSNLLSSSWMGRSPSWMHSTLYVYTFQRIEEIMKRTRKGDQSDLKVGPTLALLAVSTLS